MVTLRTVLDEHPASVECTLNQQDYERAIQAHLDDANVVMTGDLERSGERWHLRTPNIVDVISDKTEDGGLFAGGRQPMDLSKGRER